MMAWASDQNERRWMPQNILGTTMAETKQNTSMDQGRRNPIYTEEERNSMEWCEGNYTRLPHIKMLFVNLLYHMVGGA